MSKRNDANQRGPYEFQRPAAGALKQSIFRFGKLATTWPAGQAFVELTPVKSYSNPQPIGTNNVHALIFANFTTSVIPAMLAADVGDILMYVLIDKRAGSGDPPLAVLVCPPILPRGTAPAQGLLMDPAGGGAAVWDFVPAH